MSGAKTATTTAAPSRESQTSPVTCWSFTIVRTAVMRCEIGLMSANQPSTGGSVSVCTNAFDRNVSGNSTSIEMPCTLEAVRASIPNRAKIQLIDQLTTITSRPARTVQPRWSVTWW